MMGVYVKSFALLLLLGFGSLLTACRAVRHFDQRSDLQDVPPVSQSGYTIPLYGGRTCHSPEDCTSSLPAPAANKTLQVLTLARGVFVYSCVNIAPTDAPRYISQHTELYDAGPILSLLPDEATFHALVGQFYDYDYPTLKNSSLVCTGNIFTEYGTTFVDLGRFGTFSVHVQATIEPLSHPDFDAPWTWSTSRDGKWDMYRVETVNGAVPPDCQARNSTFDLGYAAEYWFYS